MNGTSTQSKMEHHRLSSTHQGGTQQKSGHHLTLRRLFEKVLDDLVSFCESSVEESHAPLVGRSSVRVYGFRT